jgi:hypothetical protein
MLPATKTTINHKPVNMEIQTKLVSLPFQLYLEKKINYFKEGKLPCYRFRQYFDI